MIINFFYGTDIGEVQPDEENLIKKESSTPKPERTLVQTALRLVFCATGLYVSFSVQNRKIFENILGLLFDLGCPPRTNYHP